MKRLSVVLVLLQVSAAMGQLTSGNIKALPPRVSTVTLNPASVTGGASVTGTVTLNQAAGSNGVTVKFSSSKPALAAVPSSVVVQPGSTSATFIIQTYPVAGSPNVVTEPPSSDISAQAGTSTVSAKLTVLPPTFTTLTLNPASLAGSNPSTGQVSLSGAAPPSGVTIGLAAVNPESAQRGGTFEIVRLQQPLVTVPQSVVVPAGGASATFPITTRAVSVSTPVQINATYGAFITKSATLTLQPPSVASLAITPAGGPGGVSLTGTVTLTSAAPGEGMAVPLSLNKGPNWSPCGTPPSIPPSVQVAAGATSANFPVTTVPSTGRWFVSSGQVSSNNFFITEAHIASLEFPTTVKGGTAIQATLKMDGNVGTCGFGGKHDLKSSDATLAQVPSQVIVPLGTNSGTFTITTAAVPDNRTVTISVYGNVNNAYQWFNKTLTLTP